MIPKVFASTDFRRYGNDAGGQFAQSPKMGRKASNEPTNNLRAWRELRQMTQLQLAAAVDTKSSVISELESGRIALSAKWLARLAPALGTTPGFLLDYDPRDLDTSFLEAALNVSKENRAQVLEILKTFKKGAA